MDATFKAFTTDDDGFTTQNPDDGWTTDWSYKPSSSNRNSAAVGHSSKASAGWSHATEPISFSPKKIDANGRPITKDKLHKSQTTDTDDNTWRQQVNAKLAFGSRRRKIKESKTYGGQNSAPTFRRNISLAPMISKECCALRFGYFKNINIKQLKRMIPHGWTKQKGAKFIEIGQTEGLGFGLYYLRQKSNIFWSQLEHDTEESHIVLYGSCIIQHGDKVKKYNCGGFVHVKRNEVHSVSTGKREEVIMGYVYPCKKEAWTINDLKYSKEKRDSVTTDDFDLLHVPKNKRKQAENSTKRLSVSDVCTQFFNPKHTQLASTTVIKEEDGGVFSDYMNETR